MNRNSCWTTAIKSLLSFIRIGLAVFFLVCLVPFQAMAQTKSTDKTMQAVEDVSDGSRQIAEDLKQRVSDSRLENWTRDEIVAWVIIGMLVGLGAGALSSLNSSGLGRVGQFLLGLGGALVGCMLVRIGEVDYEWGEAVITYEALAYSFGAAVIFILGDRIIRAQMRKKKKSS